MKPYSKIEVEQIYADILRYAYRCYRRGHINRALKGLEAASKWAYNLNFIYTDADAEKLIKDIAENKIERKQIDNPIHNRCVLIDSFLLDNRGLSQQYLRAMMANDMEILVVYTTAGGNIGRDTLSEIRSYNKAKFLSFKKGMDLIEEAQQINKSIEVFSPAHIFLHLTPWDVVALMACHSIKGPKTYQINLTDHAYWAGANFIDYNLEFRPYGYTVSLEKRGLKDEQLLALPYYPIIPISGEFEGFPNLPHNAIKVFTGGALYKMMGKDDIFFHMMERILSVAPYVYILVAGFNINKNFKEKVSNIKGGERVLQIGIRHDIDAVFDNCDIFLETYPTTGALMAQYAAIHAKPIVAYRDENDMESAIEELVYPENDFKSYTNLEAMTGYAEKLINNIDFRISEGQKLQKNMVNADQFNRSFMDLIKNHHPISAWKKDDIDYEVFFERYLELENQQFIATKTVIGCLKTKTFSAITICRKNLMEQFLKIIFNKIARLVVFNAK